LCNAGTFQKRDKESAEDTYSPNPNLAHSLKDICCQDRTMILLPASLCLAESQNARESNTGVLVITHPKLLLVCEMDTQQTLLRNIELLESESMMQ